MSIILILIIFGVIIAFHEFGHFIVAKLNKIAVLEFSIGMGPAICSFTKKETKYSIRLLPLGGYCMMLGEDEEVDDDNAFGRKSVWARMAVVLAGPVFNFVLAFIFSVFLVHFTGCDPAKLSDVAENSAAYEAGIRPGDTIKAIDDGKIHNYRELLLYMQLHNDGSPVELTMERENGEVYTVSVVPRKDADGNYKLGVMGGYIKPDSVGMELQYAGYELVYWVKATVTSLKLIITGQVGVNQIMGPVGVGDAFNEVIEEVKEESEPGKEVVINIILNMLNWSILLSVNLGVMNLLPIPALDGGRFLFLIIEAVRRKRIPQEKEALVNTIGFTILIALMVIIFFNDIKNVFFR